MAKKIKAVIFYFGNVISVTNTGDCANEMEKLTGVPAKVFRRAYEDFRFDFDRGLISGAQMYAKTLEKYGYNEVAQNISLMKKIARLDLESWKEYRQDVTDWGLLLQKQGYKIGILSNMPYEFLDLYEKHIPLFVASDCNVFSCRVHHIKPEPQIYYKILEGLTVLPEEAVFFDDLEENIQQANKIGIKGLLWKSLQQAQNDFEKMIQNQ